MAEIFPFRGITYVRDKVGSLDLVTSQPYDKITPRMREAYLARSPYNIARVILSAPPGSDLQSHFAKAAEIFHGWLADGILRRSEKPCLYPYYQTYQVPGTDQPLTRKSFIGLGRLYDYAAGVVRPHEHTHSGPKLDRLALTRATGCQFGLLFMLYSDPRAAVDAVLDEAVQDTGPLIRVEDEYGVTHQVWAIEDERTISRIQSLLREKNLYIADGHHRYETALAYWREQASRGVPVLGHEAIDRALMTFVSSQDQGLTVLPTHRVVFALADFSTTRLLERLSGNFTVTNLGPAAESLLGASLRESAGQRNTLLFASRDQDNLYRLALKSPGLAAKLIPGTHSEAWKILDVNVLHKLIFEPHLGIDESDLERESKVRYYRDPAEALSAVRGAGSGCQAAFFLNPSRVEDVVAVADRGECMPQKSTDFYPKMLTGLVINKLNLQ